MFPPARCAPAGEISPAGGDFAGEQLGRAALQDGARGSGFDQADADGGDCRGLRLAPVLRLSLRASDGSARSGATESRDTVSYWSGRVIVTAQSPDAQLERLMAESGRQLLQHAYQLTHHPQQAQDLLQDALLLAYRSWQRHPDQPVENVAAYLRMTISRRYFRLSSQEPAGGVDTFDAAFHDRGDPAAEFAQGSVDREVIWQALEHLNPRRRTVPVLRYYHQMSYAGIAAHLDCSDATARSLAARGLASMRSLVEVREGESS